MHNRKTIQNISDKVLDLLDQEGLKLQQKRSVLSIASTWLSEEEQLNHAEKQEQQEKQAVEANTRAELAQEEAREKPPRRPPQN